MGDATAAGGRSSRRALSRVSAVVCAIVAASIIGGAIGTTSTGAPLAGATNGAADARLDYTSVPGGRCSPNDSTNTIACDKLEPASTKNWASFDFVIYDVNGARCDLCGRECSLDGSAWAYCGATPVIYNGLAYGQHQFRVRGLGGDNTPDPTPAVYNWLIEAPLKVEWDSNYSTPSSYVTSTSALTFHLASTRPSSSYVQFEYSTTNDYIKTFTRLSSGVSSVSVTPSYGVNMFTFRAVSIESYTGKTLTESSVNQVSLTYVADDVIPTVSFVSGLADLATVQTSSLTYMVSSKDVDSVNGYAQAGLATLEIQLTRADNGASSPSPLQTWATYHTYSNAPTDQNVEITLTNLHTLADATYKLEVRATDHAGNVAIVVNRRFDVQLSSMVRVPDASSLNATTSERTQTASGVIKLATQPSDGSVIPVAYEVSAIVGGQLVLDSSPSTALANNTLVSATDALAGFRFTPTSGLYSNDQYSSTFGFDLKPSTSSTDLAQVVNVSAHAYITVTSVNDPPVMSVRVHYKVTTIHVSDSDNIGTLVRDVLDANVQDYDYPTSNRTVPYGIAIISADQTRGTWQFSTDDGSSWTNFHTLGALSSTNALTLQAGMNDRVRFVPTLTALEDQFTASFAFRGWDGTTGESNGATGVDITTSSHTASTGSISTSTVTAVILVRGLSHSLFERTDETVTASTKLSYTSGAYSCPPMVRRSVRIPVASGTAQAKITSSAVLTVSPPWTIEAWVRRDAWLGEQAIFLNPSDNSTIMLEMSDASGKIGVNPPSGVTGGTFNYAAPLGTWVHLAFVMYESNYPSAYSAPNANLRLIVDGKFHSELTNVGFNMPHGIIGGYGTLGFSVDEVRYWSVARSTEEIYTNMERFMAGTETGLVSYVPFDAGCGSSVRDRDSGSSASWSLIFHEWIDSRVFKCASLSAVKPAVVNLYNSQSPIVLTGERFIRPASSWGSSSVASFDGMNAVCIFGSSSVGNLTTAATVVSSTEVRCDPPDVANGISVVQPVFCDYSLGCCTGATPVDYHVAASRSYDSTYLSYAVNTPPTYEDPSLTYTLGEVTRVLPEIIDWSLGSFVTISGYGFTLPKDADFAAGGPKCIFTLGTTLLHLTDAEIVADDLIKCEFPASQPFANSEAKYSVEVGVQYTYDDRTVTSSGGWVTVVVSSYALQLGLDEALTSVSELGGSVVSITAAFEAPDTSGSMVEHAAGRVTSLDVACAFGTIRPISARYNESETFECVAPASPRAVPTTVPLSVSLFASSMFTSYTQLKLLTASGEITYVAQPTALAVWPTYAFSGAISPSTMRVIGTGLPSVSPRCQINLTFYTATYVGNVGQTDLVVCNFADFGASTPGFHAVYVGNYMLHMEDSYTSNEAHLMVRDDVYVEAIVSAGVAGPLYGGWALTLSGSGFQPGDGCSLHVAPGAVNSGVDDPSNGVFVSSALIKCVAPKLEADPESWYLEGEGGGWVTQIVARLAVESFETSSIGAVVANVNNISAVSNSYATMTTVEWASNDPVFLNVDGGTEVHVIAQNGTASTVSASCRFGTIQVLANSGWSNSTNTTYATTTTRMRCISPAFGAYSTDEVRLSVSQGDPGHHTEIVVGGLTMMKSLDGDMIVVDKGRYLVSSFTSSVPSAQLKLYECYFKGDETFVLGQLTSISSSVATCFAKESIDRLSSRTDLAFVSFALAIKGGDDVAAPMTLQYTPPPMILSVAVSAQPPPYGYRPGFAESNCTALESLTQMTYEAAHEAYEGRPQTPFEVEKFVLPPLTIFGGAWWHVSNAVGLPLHITGRYFRSAQDGGDILVSFQHEDAYATTSAHFVSSALILVEVPVVVDAEHETTIRASVDSGASWSEERLVFEIYELDYVDRDLQTIQQACAT